MFDNRAIWVLISAVALYWLMVFALGTDSARDTVDIIAMVMGTALLFMILPHAWDRLMRGGGKAEWRVIMGLALLEMQVVASSAWSFAVRAENRPLWMVENPLNGFFRWWIVGAGMLLLSAIVEQPRMGSPTKVYYVFVAFASGILVGLAGYRYLFTSQV